MEVPPAAPPVTPATDGLLAPAIVLERCLTGIEGLDSILEGGIPRGNMVLVAGSVGTGKTTLCLEFLVRGAERGERSLFLSVTEASRKLIQNLSTFEFFHTDLVENGSLVFVDLPQIYERLGLGREELTTEEIRSCCGPSATWFARSASAGWSSIASPRCVTGSGGKSRSATSCCASGRN